MNTFTLKATALRDRAAVTRILISLGYPPAHTAMVVDEMLNDETTTVVIHEYFRPQSVIRVLAANGVEAKLWESE